MQMPRADNAKILFAKKIKRQLCEKTIQIKGHKANQNKTPRSWAAYEQTEQVCFSVSICKVQLRYKNSNISCVFP